MKKLALLLLVSLVTLSCSVDDPNNYYYEILPIESFEVPESFDFGQEYTITIFYKRPNDCHANQSLYFEKKDSIRTIAVQSFVIDDGNCNTLPNELPKKGTFKFKVVNATPYLFKFYKGHDENGADIFEEVTIPVNN